MTPDTVLTDLDALLAKMSPRPWHLSIDGRWIWSGETPVLMPNPGAGLPAEQEQANAAYPALAVNHLRLQVAALETKVGPPHCYCVERNLGDRGCDGCRALAALQRDIANLKEEKNERA